MSLGLPGQYRGTRWSRVCDLIQNPAPGTDCVGERVEGVAHQRDDLSNTLDEDGVGRSPRREAPTAAIAKGREHELELGSERRVESSRSGSTSSARCRKTSAERRRGSACWRAPNADLEAL